LHPSQNNSAAKHSQYNFKHLDFLQLHGFLLTPGVPVFSLPPDLGIFPPRTALAAEEGKLRLLVVGGMAFLIEEIFVLERSFFDAELGLGSVLMGVLRRWYDGGGGGGWA
jgi:hypothetical protein